MVCWLHCTALEFLCPKGIHSLDWRAVPRHRVKLCECREKLPERWASGKVVSIRTINSMLGAPGEQRRRYNYRGCGGGWGERERCSLEPLDLHKGGGHWGLEQGWEFWRPSITVIARSCSMTITGLGSVSGQGGSQGGMAHMPEIHFIDDLSNDLILCLYIQALPVSSLVAISAVELLARQQCSSHVSKGWYSFIFTSLHEFVESLVTVFVFCCCLVFNDRLSLYSPGCLLLTCLDPPASASWTTGMYHYNNLRVSFTSFSNSESGLQVETDNKPCD